tara:strand:- start:578 stop:766 length:189 start_codon:yes stop_codon:yes gene_type:complete
MHPTHFAPPTTPAAKAKARCLSRAMDRLIEVMLSLPEGSPAQAAVEAEIADITSTLYDMYHL